MNKYLVILIISAVIARHRLDSIRIGGFGSPGGLFGGSAITGGIRSGSSVPGGLLTGPLSKIGVVSSGGARPGVIGRPFAVGQPNIFGVPQSSSPVPGGLLNGALKKIDIFSGGGTRPGVIGGPVGAGQPNIFGRPQISSPVLGGLLTAPLGKIGIVSGGARPGVIGGPVGAGQPNNFGGPQISSPVKGGLLTGIFSGGGARPGGIGGLGGVGQSSQGGYLIPRPPTALKPGSGGHLIVGGSGGRSVSSVSIEERPGRPGNTGAQIPVVDNRTRVNGVRPGASGGLLTGPQGKIVVVSDGGVREESETVIEHAGKSNKSVGPKSGFVVPGNTGTEITVVGNRTRGFAVNGVRPGASGGLLTGPQGKIVVVSDGGVREESETVIEHAGKSNKSVGPKSGSAVPGNTVVGNRTRNSEAGLLTGSKGKIVVVGDGGIGKESETIIENGRKSSKPVGPKGGSTVPGNTSGQITVVGNRTRDSAVNGNRPGGSKGKIVLVSDGGIGEESETIIENGRKSSKPVGPKSESPVPRVSTNLKTNSNLTEGQTIVEESDSKRPKSVPRPGEIRVPSAGGQLSDCSGGVIKKPKCSLCVGGKGLANCNSGPPSPAVSESTGPSGLNDLDSSSGAKGKNGYPPGIGSMTCRKCITRQNLY